MPKVQRFHLVSILINLIGIALYLFVASRFWAEPDLGDDAGVDIGAAIGWFGCAVPLLLFSCLCNVMWLLALSFRRTWIDTVFVALLICGCWVVAFQFDCAHH